MSDTITLRDKCEHGKYESHVWTTKGSAIRFKDFTTQSCPGGKERTFRQRLGFLLMSGEMMPDGTPTGITREVYVEVDDE